MTKIHMLCCVVRMSIFKSVYQVSVQVTWLAIQTKLSIWVSCCVRMSFSVDIHFMKNKFYGVLTVSFIV